MQAGNSVVTGAKFPQAGYWRPECGTRAAMEHRPLYFQAADDAPGCPWCYQDPGVLVEQMEVGPPKTRPRYSGVTLDRHDTRWFPAEKPRRG